MALHDNQAASPVEDLRAHAGSSWPIVSFDVWDTLLRRTCHPERIKVLVAKMQVNKFGFRQSSRRAYLLRLEVETAHALAAARNGRGRDCHIQDAHEAVLRHLAGPVYTPEMLRLSLGLELSVEKAMTTVDPGALVLLDLARQLAPRVVYISDFYMPRPMLEKILEHNGLLPLLDAGYVSIDHGQTKAAGGLYKAVRAGESIPETTGWLHIGDNYHSDVVSARNNGLTPVWYQPKEQHALRLQREDRFLRQHALTKVESARLALFSLLRSFQRNPDSKK